MHKMGNQIIPHYGGGTQFPPLDTRLPLFVSVQVFVSTIHFKKSTT